MQVVQPWLSTHHTIGQLSRIVPRDAIQSEHEQCDDRQRAMEQSGENAAP